MKITTQSGINLFQKSSLLRQLLGSLAIGVTLISWHEPSAEAKTITAQRIASAVGLIPLKKITVGTDDQYHGTVDPQGETLAFTRKVDLVPHICSQKISTGEISDLLPSTADSQEPVFGPHGEIAFTYYKFNAVGDICYKPLQGEKADEKITCLKTQGGEVSSPFWKSSHELGYLLKDSWTKQSKIVSTSTSGAPDSPGSPGSKESVLAEGRIWSPSMVSGGRYLVYNQFLDTSSTGSQDQRVLVLKDLQTGEARTLRFSLPGISGFPAISEDEKYLYFSHYLNDTNNDNIIDGNDNSVIFRVPIATLITSGTASGAAPGPLSGEVFPEQLTSVETNCSFPRPHGNLVYVTCAFEGSLDIYEIPATGIVPTEWNKTTLNNAHQTSRTYSERILLLNTLKYRFPETSGQVLDERILTNHLYDEDIASSRFYLAQIQRVQAADKKEARALYRLLDLYLDALGRKKTQGSSEVTPRFERDISAIREKMNQIEGANDFRSILKGLLECFLNHPEKGATYLNSVPMKVKALPLERVFLFELAQRVLPTQGLKAAALLDIYHKMLSAKELPEEAQIYYGVQFLKDFPQKASYSERIARIQKIQSNLPPAPAALLKSEEAVLEIVSASNDPAKSAAYQKLDKLMSLSRDNYFLRKAMYVRAILNFAAAREFTYLSFIASTWLRYTQNGDTEYAYARSVYAIANLDQAYDSLGKGNPELASNYFFGSLTLTDDLESHSGYIRAKVAKNQRPILTERYKNLASHQQIDDNMKFVDALLILVDAAPVASQNIKSTEYLDQALQKLGEMTQDRDSPVRFLLMGYCELEKLLRRSQGFEFDQETFDRAHRFLLLAYNQGFDNIRIKAAALMNLGILHQRVQNHGLAARFFSIRKSLGFLSDEERAQFSWLYAKSLFFNHQEWLAAKELGSAATSKLSQQVVVAFQERQAFYLQTAGKYSDAVLAYQKVLNPDRLAGDMSLAKAYLSYGFSLFKLKRDTESRQAIEKALQHMAKLQVIPKNERKWIEFHPNRLKLVAYGLLGQMGSDESRLDALQKRRALLKESGGLLDNALGTLIQNEVQMAYLARVRSPENARVFMNEALQDAEKLGDQSQYLSFSIYQTVVDSLILEMKNTTPVRTENSLIEKVLNKCISTYDSQSNQPQLVFQKLKLQVLWAAYSKKNLTSVLESEPAKKLKETLPKKWNELETLARTL